MKPFWDMDPCILVETDGRISSAYCRNRPDHGAVRNSETSVHFCETTLRHIPEDCHVHTRRPENLQC
jgi:hypothetical protein